MTKASVNGGAIGRWFEELCRIKHSRIADVVQPDHAQLKAGCLPKQGGVYSFWWTGDTGLLADEKCNRDLELMGPGGRPVSLHIDDDWLGLSTRLPIPLYIGKNSGDLAKRMGQHLMLSRGRMLPIGRDTRRQERPTTTCQLRAGVEHLFLTEPDTRSLILQNIGLSYVVLDGDAHAANRFYLEDFAVGLMKPVFNIDIER
jgi:hypothetical protein